MILDIKKLCAKARIDMYYSGKSILDNNRELRYYRFCKKYKKIILFNIVLHVFLTRNKIFVMFYGKLARKRKKIFKNKKAFLIFLKQFIDKNHKKF